MFILATNQQSPKPEKSCVLRVLIYYQLTLLNTIFEIYLHVKIGCDLSPSLREIRTNKKVHWPTFLLAGVRACTSLTYSSPFF